MEIFKLKDIESDIYHRYQKYIQLDMLSTKLIQISATCLTILVFIIILSDTPIYMIWFAVAMLIISLIIRLAFIINRKKLSSSLRVYFKMMDITGKEPNAQILKIFKYINGLNIVYNDKINK